MLWAIFALLAAIIWAATNILDKYVMTEHFHYPVAPIIITGLSGFVLAVVLSAPFLVVPEAPILFLLLLVGVIEQAASYLYFKAILTEEVSRVIPLVLLEPLFVLIFAMVFLGEFFQPLQYLGIILLVAGAILVSLRKKTKFELTPVLALALFASILFAVSTTVAKYALASIDFWNLFFWVYAGMALASLVLLVVFFKPFKDTVQKAPRAGLYSVLSGCMVGSANFVFFIAISLGAVSLASALNATQPFFVLLFATVVTVLKPKYVAEEIRKTTLLQKLVAITMIVVGSILLF